MNRTGFLGLLDADEIAARYPHQFWTKIADDSEEYDRVIEWCIANVGPKMLFTYEDCTWWDTSTQLYKAVWHFKYEHDAMLFKLRWGDLTGRYVVLK